MIHKRPVKADMKFFNQFEISPTHYHDNNNFIKYNGVETTDSRINIFEVDNEFEFLDYEEGPSWTGQEYLRKEN